MAVVLGLSGFGVYEAIAHAHRVTADRELKSVAETVHDAIEKTLTVSSNGSMNGQMNGQINGQINGQMNGQIKGQLEAVSSSLLPNLCVAGEPCRVPFEQSRGASWQHCVPK